MTSMGSKVLSDFKYRMDIFIIYEGLFLKTNFTSTLHSYNCITIHKFDYYFFSEVTRTGPGINVFFSMKRILNCFFQIQSQSFLPNKQKNGHIWEWKEIDRNESGPPELLLVVRNMINSRIIISRWFQSRPNRLKS